MLFFPSRFSVSFALCWSVQDRCWWWSRCSSRFIDLISFCWAMISSLGHKTHWLTPACWLIDRPAHSCSSYFSDGALCRVGSFLEHTFLLPVFPCQITRGELHVLCLLPAPCSSGPFFSVFFHVVQISSVLRWWVHHLMERTLRTLSVSVRRDLAKGHNKR